MDETLERIMQLLHEKSITAAEIETIIQVPRGSFSNWKRGHGKLYYAYIDQIADRLGVSIDYLVRGMDVQSDSLNTREAEVITMYRELPEKAKRVVFENMRLLVDGPAGKATDE